MKILKYASILFLAVILLSQSAFAQSCPPPDFGSGPYPHVVPDYIKEYVIEANGGNEIQDWWFGYWYPDVFPCTDGKWFLTVSQDGFFYFPQPLFTGREYNRDTRTLGPVYHFFFFDGQKPLTMRWRFFPSSPAAAAVRK